MMDFFRNYDTFDKDVIYLFNEAELENGSYLPLYRMMKSILVKRASDS